MAKYSECDKLVIVNKESQKIGEFLDWLRNEKEYLLMTDEGEDDDGNPIYNPVIVSIEKLLAEYFKIDMNKVEKERRVMLKELQGND